MSKPLFIRHFVVAGNIRTNIYITADESGEYISDFDEMCNFCGKEFYAKAKRCPDCDAPFNHEKHEAAVLKAGFNVYS